MATRKTSEAKIQAAKAEAKTPTDFEKSFDEVEGNHLLRPLNEVKGSDQLRLIAQLQQLGLTGDEGQEVDTNDLDFEKVADLIDYVAEHFAKDISQFEDFTAGKGGFERALELVMAYAEALGE